SQSAVHSLGMHPPTLLLICLLIATSISEAKIYQASAVSRLSQPECGGMKFNDCHDQNGFDEFQDKRRTMPRVDRHSRANRY
ncbi:hypothetical protein PENTCL1PPCAC_2640, partial [Pristionchus entomophagus]